MIPVFFGLAGTALSASEQALFREVQPAGYILFGRNIADCDQLTALTQELKSLSGNNALPILVDQEGGRVARLAPPNWPKFPAGAQFDRLFELAPAGAMMAARCNARALAHILRDVGITVNCLPMLDVRHPAADDVVGDRALGSEPLRVAALGRAILEGLALGGIVGVAKHIPGHGRALVDSHKGLPRVSASDAELTIDYTPFKALAPITPMAMTAHVVFDAWDDARCATLSPIVIGDVIRGAIGFDGLLMSDDLTMQALTGPIEQRAVAALAAGCDIALHCSGEMAEMEAIASAVQAIAPAALARLQNAMRATEPPEETPSLAELLAQRDALLALV